MANSPYLHPVNYKIWGILQERVYRTKVKDVSDLKQRIVDEWDKLHQSVIDIPKDCVETAAALACEK